MAGSKLSWNNLPPEEGGFHATHLSGGGFKTSRSEALKEAARLTGKNIIDIGNATEQELASTLNAMVSGSGMGEIAPKHVLIGHGEGVGPAWSFAKRNGFAGENILSRVAKEAGDDAAYVIACGDGKLRQFNRAEGKVVAGARTALQKMEAVNVAAAKALPEVGSSLAKVSRAGRIAAKLLRR
jgi:hypothetical protein